MQAGVGDDDLPFLLMELVQARDGLITLDGLPARWAPLPLAVLNALHSALGGRRGRGRKLALDGLIFRLGSRHHTRDGGDVRVDRGEFVGEVLARLNLGNQGRHVGVELGNRRHERGVFLGFRGDGRIELGESYCHFRDFLREIGECE
jgi:hypothetical protein